MIPIITAMFVTLLILRVARRRRATQRVVERPNSHYTAQITRETEARHRWHAMPLDRVHEINREEVVRLLAKAETGSVQALNGKERAFLDYMAELAGITATTGRPADPSPPSSPRLPPRTT